MRAREPRRTVFIKARMRLGTRWHDVCIRNISSRGMMIAAADAPPRGTYVELRRGRHVVVGRVAWAKDDRFGIQSQERLPIDAIVAEPDRSGVDYRKAVEAEPAFERRAAPRVRMSAAERSDKARFAARAMEYASTAAAACIFAALIAGAVVQAVATPMSRIGDALAGAAPGKGR